MGSSDSCNFIADCQDSKTASMGTGGKQTEAHSPRMFVCIGVSWHGTKPLQAPAGAQTVLDMHTLTAHPAHWEIQNGQWADTNMSLIWHTLEMHLSQSSFPYPFSSSPPPPSSLFPPLPCNPLQRLPLVNMKWYFMRDTGIPCNLLGCDAARSQQNYLAWAFLFSCCRLK